ncbi:uncharacterized protein EAF02_004944 [Botrytis sinoallii]|uniref:uncharacterized protein n=1 Tax=Botrytis sinoallii TaxID=1463999 RepID=UPI001901E1E7|nr:uncharacterized protein EAF02_004944 [Botrytis sinoallii]KAF7884608.1 hypothetical protein EAF02_004944 [Botrytis sinoallii]
MHRNLTSGPYSLSNCPIVSYNGGVDQDATAKYIHKSISGVVRQLLGIYKYTAMTGDLVNGCQG